LGAVGDRRRPGYVYAIVLVALVALPLIAAACGGGGGSKTTTSTTETTVAGQQSSGGGGGGSASTTGGGTVITLKTFTTIGPITGLTFLTIPPT
jgi:hypothetical protein